MRGMGPSTTERNILQSNGQKARDWTQNGVEGRGLRRAFKRLLQDLDQSNNAVERATIARALAYLAQAKGTIAKMERELEVEERLARLEAAAGLARKGGPPSR